MRVMLMRLIRHFLLSETTITTRVQQCSLSGLCAHSSYQCGLFLFGFFFWLTRRGVVDIVFH